MNAFAPASIRSVDAPRPIAVCPLLDSLTVTSPTASCPRVTDRLA